MKTLLTEKENEQAAEFVWAHYARKCSPRYRPWRVATRAEVQVTAKATGIGFGITLKCLNCGEEKDVTDFESW